MPKNIKNQAVVGLSGGVDSSVALMLLKEQGFAPVGVSLKYAAWQSKKNLCRENVCCSAESFNIARRVCRKLKVPYHILDCGAEFKKEVIDYFLKITKGKMTPSPCAICNRQIKFAKLIEFAEKKDIKYVATGHYARISLGFDPRVKPEGQTLKLLTAKDKAKDQTYFLCLLTQKQLSRIIFPLANYTKPEVYQIAKKQSFAFFEKRKQSQDLCFVAQKSIPHFLREKIGVQPGEIINQKGNVLGKHQGLHFYTIGQRHGLNLAQGPWWVIGYNKRKNQLIVTNQENDPALFSQKIIIKNYNFISGQTPRKPIIIKAKIRISHQPALAKLYPPEKGKLKLVFNKPQKAVTPGQWAVFYDRKTCLGGGMIVNRTKD